MIVLISVDGRPPTQLLITKRTTVQAVQDLLQLPAGPAAWQTDNSWALADQDARLFDVAGDLQGDGSSVRKAFHVRAAMASAAAPDGAAAMGNHRHVALQAASSHTHGSLGEVRMTSLSAFPRRAL